MKPSNTAVSIRVLSPGKGGDVTQSNDATAVGIAKNDNETKQSIDQSQPGGYGSDYTQIAGQKAKNEQKADADATAVQVKPSNTAASIRVLSPGRRRRRRPVEQHDRDRGRAERQRDEAVDRPDPGLSASMKKAPENEKADEKDGHSDKGGSLHADRRPEGRQRAEGRR